MMNKKNIEKIIKELLIEIGEDPKREGLKDTPKRIANLYEELLNGNQEDPKEILNVTYSTKQDEMIIVKDIPLYSLCEHHLLPFFGKCHIAYIPRNGKVVGLSKLARIVSLYSKRLQLQERITTQIADTIMQELKPFGVGVIIKAKHMCMEMRGAKAFDSSTITSALRGSFKKDIRTREEFLELIKNVD